MVKSLLVEMPNVMVFPGSNVFGCEMTIDCQGENIDDD